MSTMRPKERILCDVFNSKTATLKSTPPWFKKRAKSSRFLSKRVCVREKREREKRERREREEKERERKRQQSEINTHTSVAEW